MFFKGKNLMEIISGFSKLSKVEKIHWLTGQVNKESLSVFDKFWHQDESLQKVIDDFSENTISNYIFPYGIAPNFLIDDKIYAIPMVIEESSVVAAASKSAKFWQERGGFKTKVLSTLKVGHVHFLFNGEKEKINNFFQIHRAKFLKSISPLVANMEKRGGGLVDLKLIDRTRSLENYYQLEAKFETCDAMGANFINSVLEKIAQTLVQYAEVENSFSQSEKNIEVIMSILSNYTPECVVRAWVECPIEDLGQFDTGMKAQEFAFKFERAVQIAKIDVNRAVTHNKGIFNGIDALVLATGNDFRAIEACGHAYAARDGQYRGLSSCTISDGLFRFELEIPLALGTVGGLTSLHPMARASLDLLDNPSANTLMRLCACVGLAQNFGALRSLVTTGIQKGHMKMHLLNILNQLGASANQIEMAKSYFEDKTVSFSAVRDFLNNTTLQ
jgi:hydroxymethylglutaryl-CoA reductase